MAMMIGIQLERFHCPVVKSLLAQAASTSSLVVHAPSCQLEFFSNSTERGLRWSCSHNRFFPKGELGTRCPAVKLRPDGKGSPRFLNFGHHVLRVFTVPISCLGPFHAARRTPRRTPVTSYLNLLLVFRENVSAGGKEPT